MLENRAENVRAGLVRWSIRTIDPDESPALHVDDNGGSKASIGEPIAGLVRIGEEVQSRSETEGRFPVTCC